MKRLLLPWSAAVLIAMLLGCGPGVGGTGTGEAGEFLRDFGAVEKPLCDAPFATRLDCDGPTPPNGPAPGPGTDVVTAVDVASGGRVVVVFRGNTVGLDAHCADVAFDGVWGATATGDASFYGGVRLPGLPARSAGSLAVEAVAGSTGGELRITLRTLDGRIVIGPLVVRPAQAPPAPVACP